jgi:hypothetical protein
MLLLLRAWLLAAPIRHLLACCLLGSVLLFLTNFKYYMQ